MVLPSPMDNFRIKPSLFRQFSSVEKFFGPRPKRPLDPFADRHGKARLWPVDQRLGDMAVEQLAQDLLAATTSDFVIDRYPCRQRRDPVIKEGYTCFEAHRHRCAIDFAENVVRQVADGIAVHHSNFVRRRPAKIEIELTAFAGCGDGAFLQTPFIEEIQIDVIDS